jgi:Ca-activated chloride channel family protein
MWRFESPSHLWWLILAPVFLLLFFYFSRRWQTVSAKSFGNRVFPYLVQNFSFKKAFFKVVCLSLALSLFVLSWSRLQMGKGQNEVKSEGVEIMLLVDVSRSMLAEDVRPSRLEHAKKEIMRLLDMLGGDKVGLIAFAGSSVLLSPLTVDKAALKMFVEGLSPESVETQGTEIGPALSEAKEALTRGGAESDEQSRVTKVVLVMSDGEDHEAGTEKIAQDMAKEGIRIFTMAFGTEAGAKVPIRDQRNTLVEYLRDKSNQEVVTKVKGDFLRAIASAGKGSFYHVTFGGDQMKSVKEDLDRLEKSEFDTLMAASYEERYQWMLLLGLLFALLEIYLGNKKSGNVKWKGRFPI